MAIRIIEGVIGSGKTYYAVRHVARSYFDFNSDLQIYQSKDPNLIIYSNIDRFSLAQPLEPHIQDAGGLSNFFNIDNQKRFIQGKKVVYVIDEAQGPNFFHRKFYNPEVFFFFQYHRHLGIDIYLITQDVFSLARELRDLAEYHIKARRRTSTLTGEFTYFFMCGDEKWKTQSLRPDKQFFSLYKSMQSEEVEKIGSASRRYALIFALLIVFAFLVFYYGFLGIYMPTKKAVAGKSDSKPVSTLVVLPTLNPETIVEIPQQVTNKDVSYKQPEITTSNEVELIEITVSGLLYDSEIGRSFVTFIDNENREFTLSGFEFDKLCKCNTLAKLRSGDSLLIEKPPTGTRYRRLVKENSTYSIQPTIVGISSEVPQLLEQASSSNN